MIVDDFKMVLEETGFPVAYMRFAIDVIVIQYVEVLMMRVLISRWFMIHQVVIPCNSFFLLLFVLSLPSNDSEI